MTIPAQLLATLMLSEACAIRFEAAGRLYGIHAASPDVRDAWRRTSKAHIRAALALADQIAAESGMDGADHRLPSQVWRDRLLVDQRRRT